MTNTTKRLYLTKEEIIAFTDENSSYYVRHWENNTSFFKGWNWAATIFPIQWLAFRKMYLEALIACLMSLGIFIIAAPWGLWGFAFLIYRILIGAFGNSLYYQKALRTLNKITSTTDKNLVNYTLQQKGGVKQIVFVICIILEIVLFFTRF